MSLNTNVYRIYAGDVAVKTRVGAIIGRPPREVLTASVQLTNRGSDDLTFTFPSGATEPQQRFEFRIFNSAGEQVWTSVGTDLSTEGTTPVVLRKYSKWSSTAVVPLKPGGAWLPVGVYTLEASLAGTPTVGATTLFEIAEPPALPQPVPPKNTGIRGQVLRAIGLHRRLDGSVIAPSVMPHGIPAKIQIEEIVEASSTVRFKAPFVWRGDTTSDGRFEAATPPGRFRVTVQAQDLVTATVVLGAGDASTPASVLLPPIPAQTTAVVQTTVQRGAYADLQVTMSGGMIFEQPHTDTGIKGQFFLPPSEAAPQNQVAVGASVVVSELLSRPTNGIPIVISPGFSWSGVTDAEGRFQVNTPPGRYRIIVQWSKPSPPAGTGTLAFVNWDDVPMRGEFEATVVDGQIFDISGTLQLDLVGPAKRVYSVEDISLGFLATNGFTGDRIAVTLPPMLARVSVQGKVSSGGWSRPQLRKRGVTEDGIIEFDFVALPPSGPAPQVISNVYASVDLPEWASYRGVRVYSATNQVQFLKGQFETN